MTAAPMGTTLSDMVLRVPPDVQRLTQYAAVTAEPPPPPEAFHDVPSLRYSVLDAVL
jgi:hypothetical protein